MKKLSLMIIFAVLCLAIFVGCKNNQNPPDGSHEHSFSEWKTVKQASCTEEGQKERTCACGEKETVTLPMTTHNFVNGVCDKCGAKPSEGLEYTLNSDGKSYKVSGIGTCTDKDIIIPDTYENLPVTNIGISAFMYCTKITSITISNSVTSIDDRAFMNCTELTNITIPNSVTSIGFYTFFKCTKLTSITIPNSVTKIDVGAFLGCTGLTSIMIPESVTSIGDSVFSGCTGLTNIDVDSKNTHYHSVNNCLIETASKKLITGRKNSIIPDDGSVTSIGNYAFYGCKGLTSITIPSNVTSIGVHVFSECTELASINVDSKNTHYHSVNNCLIETASKTLIAGCQNSVIPDDGSVTSIGGTAFCGYTGLTSITIPDSVTSIGQNAFNSCTGLTSITIPNGVTSIGDGAFNNCTGFISITIPDNVTSIGQWAFGGCTGLTSITIPNSVTSIGDGAFRNCTGLTTITIPGSITSIGNYAFNDCMGITDITIPDSVTIIGRCAFYNCSKLTSITIPNSVTSIDPEAFKYCTKLTTITFKGTKDQWNAITKNAGWDSNTGAYVIHCTDGDITK